MHLHAILILASIGLLMAAPAHAYVDPGTGGMLLQLVTGGVAGLLVLARLYWRRAKDAIAAGRTAPSSPEHPVAEPPTSIDPR